MRRLTLLFAGGAVWLFLAAIPVFADGGPHIASINSGAGGINADSCAGCHRAHTAQGPLLLIDAQPAMCLACHGTAGTGATTDVANGVQYALGTTQVRGTAVVGALRDGGFVNARIDSANGARLAYSSGTSVRELGMVPATATGAAVTSAHMPNALGVVGVATGIAWGNGPISATANLGATVTVECTTCHNPHGNGNYRILNPIPAPGAVTGGGTFVPATTGALVTDAALPPAGDTRNYTIHQNNVAGANGMLLLSQAATGTTATSGDYFHRKVPWNGTTGTINDNPNGDSANFNTQMNAWCATCHTRLNAPSGAHSVSSGDGVFTYRHPVRSSSPACTTCHVAHGTNAAMTGAAAVGFNIVPGDSTTASSSSFLLKANNRGTCQLCHDPTGTITVGTYIGPVPSPATP